MITHCTKRNTLFILTNRYFPPEVSESHEKYILLKLQEKKIERTFFVVT